MYHIDLDWMKKFNLKNTTKLIKNPEFEEYNGYPIGKEGLKIFSNLKWAAAEKQLYYLLGCITYFDLLYPGWGQLFTPELKIDILECGRPWLYKNNLLPPNDNSVELCFLDACKKKKAFKKQFMVYDIQYFFTMGDIFQSRGRNYFLTIISPYLTHMLNYAFLSEMLNQYSKQDQLFSLLRTGSPDTPATIDESIRRPEGQPFKTYNRVYYGESLGFTVILYYRFPLTLITGVKTVEDADRILPFYDSAYIHHIGVFPLSSIKKIESYKNCIDPEFLTRKKWGHIYGD